MNSPSIHAAQQSSQAGVRRIEARPGQAVSALPMLFAAGSFRDCDDAIWVESSNAVVVPWSVMSWFAPEAQSAMAAHLIYQTRYRCIAERSRGTLSSASYPEQDFSLCATATH